MGVPAEAALPGVSGGLDAGVLRHDPVQDGRNRLAVQLRGAVIHIRVRQADLVFNLHRDNRPAFPVQSGDMLHESGERAAVRLPGRFAQRGKGRDVRPVRAFCRAVDLRMKLHPFRDIVGMPVLVEAEPQGNQVYAGLPASADQVVQIGKIKDALLGFASEPVYRGLQDVPAEQLQGRHLPVHHLRIAR